MLPVQTNNTFMDYRTSDNRLEGFIGWFIWAVRNGDCDPALWAMNYLNERYEYSREERFWFAWLYHTYNLPTAFVYKNEFPDEELASVERFSAWNDANYARLRYQVDTKWSKGHLAAMYASYSEWVGDQRQEDLFTEATRGTPQENFDSLWKIANSWYKFGRYTAFFYLQTIKHTCGVDIEPPGQFFNNFKGSQSHRNGFCYAMGKEEWVNEKLTPEQYQWLEDAAADVLREAKKAAPDVADKLDNFALETCLCSYKKLWRVKKGRYMGYYLDRQSEEILKAESDGWEGIDWSVMWEAREEVIGSALAPRGATVDKDKMALFLETGKFHHSCYALPTPVKA